MTNEELLAKYGPLMEPLLPMAKKAYGSRDLDTPQHTASREYTRLLCEFYALGGSLIDLSRVLGVTYAGMRRRIITADTRLDKPKVKPKFSEADYEEMADQVISVKIDWGRDAYHRTLYDAYVNGYSMAKLAKTMNLSSANPLYYALNKIKREQGL